MKPEIIKKMILGFNLKDRVSNVASLMSLIGSLMLVATNTGHINANQKQNAELLIGASVILGAFVTGKSGDLKGGQVDRES